MFSYCININHLDQKVSQYNDGFVNFPKNAYDSCTLYLEQTRPKPYCSNDNLLVWPESERAVNSQDLGLICKSAFRVLFDKEFNFSTFRQFMQSVFAQTCMDKNEKRWFNRLMQHR